jgi:hypothetical protein
MKHRRKALVVTLALAAQVAVGTVAATTAGASTGPADDRQLSTPTSWWSYSGVTAATLGTLLSHNHARLTDLQVDNTASTPTFTAVMVANSGSYASASWWYYGLTQSQVSAHLSTNKARLLTAQTYNTSAGVRYAVAMVPNTGSNAKSWWWYVGTTSALSAQLNSHHARMINVSPYAGSSTNYVGIMVDNTGTNASGWWWYVHASAASVASHLSADKAHLVDLSRNVDGTFNAVMYAGTSTRWYWYYGQDLSTAVTRALQQGERIIDATPYTVSGKKYFAVVETRNTNTLSEKLWNVIAPSVDSGKYGFYLKQVGGSTLAGIGQSTQYEPASALKVLYHAESIHQQSVGASHDGDPITYHYDPAHPTDGGICPDSFATTATTTLKNADQQMMWNSDNRMTRGVLAKYGKAAVLSYGSSLGLTATAINHNIGCPTSTTHNKTTLVDLGKVYEAYQNGTITSNATWKAQFKARMLNESNYSGFRNSICPIVNQEATALGKSKATATAFCNALTWVAKGGSYQYGSSLPYQVSWDGVSLTGLPYKASGAVTAKYFVFGEYVDGTTINSTSEATAINTARGKEYLEAMRPYLHAALATWS